MYRIYQYLRSSPSPRRRWIFGKRPIPTYVTKQYTVPRPYMDHPIRTFFEKLRTTFSNTKGVLIGPGDCIHCNRNIFTILILAIISLSCSLVLAIIVGVGSYFIFVKRFKNKWYGGDEKKRTNGTIVTMPTYEKVPSERSDSGYNTPGKNKKDKSIKEPKLNTELIKLVAQNQKKPKSSTATVSTT